MAVIYGLFDPRRPLWLWEVRYVGQTIVIDVQARLRQHISDAKRGGDRYLYRWIRSLLQAEVRPHMQILERCDLGQRHVREIAWIAEGRRQGWRLTNATDGGEGNHGFRASAETREKQRLAKLGKQHSEEQRRNETEAIRRARQEDPTIGMRGGEARKRYYTNNPEVKIAISQNRKLWWSTNPEMRLIYSQNERAYNQEHPEMIVKRNQAIKEGHARQDKSPTMCECGAGPFRGSAGLNRHIAQKH